MIVDIFAGPGGWDLGLAALGRDDIVGVELDDEITRTREAAGLATIHADVTSLDPAQFYGYEGLIASPPCQSFSSAGLQRGLADLRGQLVWQVIRYAEAIRPQWIACEEVKEVLPIWRSIASHLRGMGYNTWAGLLNAADYGVPQTRVRAFLMASRSPFAMPEPTHAQHAQGALFGSVEPWVTMADALNLTPDDLQPGQEWCLSRPATTVVRSFRPDVIAAPGWRLPGDGPRQNTPGSVTVTEEQMKLLQTVPVDFPITGAKTKRQSIIGAFLPPRWAAAVLAPLLAAPPAVICQECGNDLVSEGLTVCLDCMEATHAAPACH